MIKKAIIAGLLSGITITSALAANNLNIQTPDIKAIIPPPPKLRTLAYQNDMEVHAMSYNVQTGEGKAPGDFERRLPEIVDQMLKYGHQDVYGLQETKNHRNGDKNCEEIKQELNKRGAHYDYFSAADLGDGKNDADNSIFYDSYKYELVAHGGRQLAQDIYDPRYALYVVLKDKTTGKEMIVFNTHGPTRVDGVHQEGYTQAEYKAFSDFEESVRQQYGGDHVPVINTGDWNPGDKKASIHAFDGQGIHDITNGPTYPTPNPKDMDDHILVGGDVASSSFTVDGQGDHKARNASDHYPVSADIHFRV